MFERLLAQTLADFTVFVEAIIAPLKLRVTAIVETNFACLRSSGVAHLHFAGTQSQAQLFQLFFQLDTIRTVPPWEPCGGSLENRAAVRFRSLCRTRTSDPHVGIPELTFPPYLTLSLSPPGGQRVGTFTTVRPRKSRPPRIQSDCVRAFVRRCVSLTATVSGPRLRRLTLEDVLHGSTVAIECRGGGCPRRRFERVVRVPAGRGPYRTLGLSGYTGLRTGAVVRLYVTRPGSFGVYRTLRITRASVRISGYRCIALTSRRRLAACPA